MGHVGVSGSCRDGVGCVMQGWGGVGQVFVLMGLCSSCCILIACPSSDSCLFA